MSLWHDFWNDEAGGVVSAELVAVGAVGVAGGAAGLNLLDTSLNRELDEAAFAIRSLDQSYAVAGHSSCGAWTAGSCYMQPNVEESLAELRAMRDEQRAREDKRERKARKHRRQERQSSTESGISPETGLPDAFLQVNEQAQPNGETIDPADDASLSEVVIEPVLPE